MVHRSFYSKVAAACSVVQLTMTTGNVKRSDGVTALLEATHKCLNQIHHYDGVDHVLAVICEMLKDDSVDVNVRDCDCDGATALICASVHQNICWEKSLYMGEAGTDSRKES